MVLYKAIHRSSGGYSPGFSEYERVYPTGRIKYITDIKGNTNLFFEVKGLIFKSWISEYRLIIGHEEKEEIVECY